MTQDYFSTPPDPQMPIKVSKVSKHVSNMFTQGFLDFTPNNHVDVKFCSESSCGVHVIHGVRLQLTLLKGQLQLACRVLTVWKGGLGES